MLDTAHAYTFCLLTATSVAYQVAFRRWERLRRAVSNNRVPDLISTWTTAAVIALPLPWALAAIAVYYLPDWNPRSTGQGPRAVQFGKFVYSIGAAELAAVLASSVLHLLGLLALPMAIVGFMGVNFGLVVLAMVLSGERRRLPMMLRPRAHVLETVGHCLGVALALVLVWHVLLILLALPLLAALHIVASRDAALATGAFNQERQAWDFEAWRFRANEMQSDSGYCSAIVVDMHGSTEPQRVNILRSCVGDANPIGVFGDMYVVFAATETVWAVDLLVARIERWLDTAGVAVTVGIASGHDRTADELVTDAVQDLAGQQWHSDSAAAGA